MNTWNTYCKNGRQLSCRKVDFAFAKLPVISAAAKVKTLMQSMHLQILQTCPLQPKMFAAATIKLWQRLSVQITLEEQKQSAPNQQNKKNQLMSRACGNDIALFLTGHSQAAFHRTNSNSYKSRDTFHFV